MINENIEDTNSVLTNAINNDTINTEATEPQVASYAVNAASDTSGATAGSTMATAIELPIDVWRSGSIECECGEAWFKFTANEPAAHYNGGNGEYTITTNGGEDTVGYLYNSSGSLLDEDDDGGIGMQFSITASLKYGSTYYVRVKEYNCRACDFNIKVTYTPIEYTGEDTARAFPLTLGVSTDGTLCCPEGAVWYKFVANDSSVHTSGYAKYNVTVDSAIDANVTLYDTNNQLISFYDSEKNGSTLVKSAKLYYNIPYYVVVETFNQECGDFSIRVDGMTKWVNVTSVSIDQLSCTLLEGHTQRLTATVKPDDATYKSVIWSTSNAACASVSADKGVVVANCEGSATITAKSRDITSKKSSVNVTVSSDHSTETNENDGAWGSILYNGDRYDIFVPNHITGDTLKGWQVVEEISDSTFNFYWAEFLAGTIMGVDDVNGILTGENPDSNFLTQQQIYKTFGVGILCGVLQALPSSVSHTYLKFTFLQKDGKKKVIIKAGSSDIQQLFKSYADGITYTHFDSINSTAFTKGHISRSAEKLYEQIIGEEVSLPFYKSYDIGITIDESHKGSKYASYLWIDKEGNVMEKPIYYKNDKLEIGERFYVVVWGGFKPLIEVPKNGSHPVSEEYQKIFSDAINEN